MPKWKGMKKDLRLEEIKKGLLANQTFIEIAATCGVHRVTVSRDWNEYIKTDAFRLWMHELYVRKLGAVTDTAALASLTRLMVKYQVSVSQIEQKGEVRVVVRMESIEPDPKESRE